MSVLGPCRYSFATTRWSSSAARSRRRDQALARKGDDRRDGGGPKRHGGGRRTGRGRSPDRQELGGRSLERISELPLEVLGQTKAWPESRARASIASASLSTITPRVGDLKCALCPHPDVGSSGNRDEVTRVWPFLQGGERRHMTGECDSRTGCVPGRSSLGDSRRGFLKDTLNLVVAATLALRTLDL